MPFSFYYIFVPYACICEPADTRFHPWRSENNLRESLFSFHHVRSGDQTQVIRSGCKHPYPLIHLTGPGILFSTCASFKTVPTRWALGLIVGMLEYITFHRQELLSNLIHLVNGEVLRIEPRSSCTLGKCFTTKLYLCPNYPPLKTLLLLRVKLIILLLVIYIYFYISSSISFLIF